jgi:hypothetical protein
VDGQDNPTSCMLIYCIMPGVGTVIWENAQGFIPNQPPWDLLDCGDHLLPPQAPAPAPVFAHGGGIYPILQQGHNYEVVINDPDFCWHYEKDGVVREGNFLGTFSQVQCSVRLS